MIAVLHHTSPKSVFCTRILKGVHVEPSLDL